MGFSTSGAAAVIFIGLLVAASFAFPAMESAYESRSSAMETQEERTLNVKNTDVAVNASQDAGDLVVTVTNAGATTLSVNGTDLLLDGGYYGVDASSGTTLVDGTDGRTTYGPGETLRIETGTAAANVTRVKVVTENGLARTVEV